MFGAEPGWCVTVTALYVGVFMSGARAETCLETSALLLLGFFFCDCVIYKNLDPQPWAPWPPNESLF